MSIASQVLEMIGTVAQTPSLAREFSADEQKSIYSCAYKHYQLCQYDKASALFTQLTLCAPLQLDYWHGYASSHQMQNMYDLAIHGWAICSLLSSCDPLYHYHAAECLFAKNDVNDANKALDLCLGEAKDEDLRAKAQQLKQLCLKNHASKESLCTQ